MMTIIDRIKQDRIQAMKDKNIPVKDVLGLIFSTIQQRTIDEPTLGEETIIQMIKKEIKSVREMKQLYADARRDDEAGAEQAKIDALEEYLPEMLSDDALRELIEQSWFDLVASKRGQIIGSLMKSHRAVIDPAQLQQVLDDLLDG